MPGPEKVFRFLRRMSIMSSGCRRLQALKAGPPVRIRGPWRKEVGAFGTRPHGGAADGLRPSSQWYVEARPADQPRRTGRRPRSLVKLPLALEGAYRIYDWATFGGWLRRTRHALDFHAFHRPTHLRAMIGT